MTTPLDDKNVFIPDLPEHWKFGKETDPIEVPPSPRLFIHRLLCLISFGCGNLQTVWNKSHTSDWGTVRNDMKERLQHINLVAALLLATISAFCTTDPPANSKILPYTNTVPYCFLLSSMCFSIAGLCIGSCGAFVIHKVDCTWFRKALMGSKRRIWITTITFSLPFFITTISIWALIAGFIVAASSSEVPFVKFGLGFFIALPLVPSLVAFGWKVFFKPEAFWRLWKHLTS